MTFTITQLFFGFLCGILFVVGLILGLNYEEVSVYVCIYLWPILCTAMPLFLTIYALYKWIKKGSFIRTLNLSVLTFITCLFSGISKLFFDNYSAPNMSHGRMDTVHDKFIACQNDLIHIAGKLNMSYEMLNLWVYCFMFITIVAVFWFWFECMYPKRLFINKLWINRTN